MLTNHAPRRLCAVQPWSRPADPPPRLPSPPLPCPPRCLQWKEMVAEVSGRITRPRQIYTGELRRKFIPVYERQLSGRISGEASVAGLAGRLRRRVGQAGGGAGWAGRSGRTTALIGQSQGRPWRCGCMNKGSRGSASAAPASPQRRLPACPPWPPLQCPLTSRRPVGFAATCCRGLSTPLRVPRCARQPAPHGGARCAAETLAPRAAALAQRLAAGGAAPAAAPASQAASARPGEGERGH